MKIAQGLLKAKPLELFAEDLELDGELIEMVEGEESAEFTTLLGDDRTTYHSLLEREEDFDFTPRLFKMSSITGDFTASEILCPHRSQHSSPYPFVQYELYSASQPGMSWEAFEGTFSLNVGLCRVVAVRQPPRAVALAGLVARERRRQRT